VALPCLAVVILTLLETSKTVQSLAIAGSTLLGRRLSPAGQSGIPAAQDKLSADKLSAAAQPRSSGHSTKSTCRAGLFIAAAAASAVATAREFKLRRGRRPSDISAASSLKAEFDPAGADGLTERPAGFKVEKSEQVGPAARQ